MDIVEVREGDVIERPLSIDEKLRLHCEWQEKDHTNGDYFHLLAKEAAATITALRARVAELEGALGTVAKMRREVTTEYDGRTYLECSSCGCSLSEGEPHDEDCAWPIIDAALRAKGGDDPHSDDLAVDRFAAAMKAKLAQKRAEGRGGWDDKDACSGERLSRLLRGHVEKGDPVDVANFAMMLHQRGERIAP